MIVFNKKNAKMWSRLGPRATYGLAMLDLIENNSSVYTLSADLGSSSGLSRVMETYQDHYINVGIAEQNLIGVSAGLAKEGLIPFASSFAPFITHRCADQIRMCMGYMHLNIKTVGLGSGISMSVLGNSHYGTDDIAFLRSIPGLVILSPCDCMELVKCVQAAAEYDGPVYIRMTGEPGMPKVYEEDFEFKIGKNIELRNGEDVMIYATGSMVVKALQVADSLAEKGVAASVIDVHTIKPFDKSLLMNVDERCKLIVTIEEHNVVSGFGAEVCRLAALLNHSPRILNVGLEDEYLKAGSYSYMLEKYGLTADSIEQKILDLLDK